MKIKCDLTVDLETGKYDVSFRKLRGKGKIDSERLFVMMRKVINSLESQAAKIDTFTKLLH